MEYENQKAGFIGRFQPLHLGHHKVIENNKDRFQEFVILVGSASKSEEEENPLSFKERKEIIETCFPDVKIIGVDDTERDRDWAKSLEDLGIDVILSGNNWVKEALESTDMDVVEPELHEPSIYSGTEIRRRVKSKEEWRYLVPNCSEDELEKKIAKIRESGITYEFEPGWKRDNAYHSTAEK